MTYGIKYDYSNLGGVEDLNYVQMSDWMKFSSCESKIEYYFWCVESEHMKTLTVFDEAGVTRRASVCDETPESRGMQLIKV